MKGTHLTIHGNRISLRRGLILAVLTALLGTALLGSQLASSSASAKKKANTEVVDIRGAKKAGGQGVRLYFDGPETVRVGDILKIRSLTDGRNVGPHTFSLAQPRVIPETKSDRNRCFAPGGVCLAIAKAHTGGKPDGPVTDNPAEAGKAGWDTQFTSSKFGDSWYSGSKPGNSFKQIVSAKAGSELTFVCAIHPNMNGSIKVLPAKN